jgi:hypothetical protein
MAVQRVDQVRNRAVADQQRQEVQFQRLNLFTAEKFERVSSVSFGESRVSVPHMSTSDQATASQLFGSVPAEKQPEVQAAFDNLAGLIYSEGKDNLDGVNVGSFSAPLVNALGNSLEVFMTTSGVDKADNAVQGVMFGAMVGIEQDLSNFASNLKDKINMSSEMRTDITELQNELADPTWTDSDTDTRSFSWREIETDADGNVTGFTEHTGELNKAQAQTKLKELEEQRATLGDFTEMMKFDLQQMSENYQQALNTLSNLLKSQHDSLMAIIRNVKG